MQFGGGLRRMWPARPLLRLELRDDARQLRVVHLLAPGAHAQQARHVAREAVQVRHPSWPARRPAPRGSRRLHRYKGAVSQGDGCPCWRGLLPHAWRLLRVIPHMGQVAGRGLALQVAQQQQVCLQLRRQRAHPAHQLLRVLGILWLSRRGLPFLCHLHEAQVAVPAQRTLPARGVLPSVGHRRSAADAWVRLCTTLRHHHHSHPVLCVSPRVEVYLDYLRRPPAGSPTGT
mmetsp:Transcript_24377/g.63319  ORF Transcript_24377/g.63319 Transcript_24377/m.63319 type:complete len:231 (-) Transcript_24377:230-922(-)